MDIKSLGTNSRLSINHEYVRSFHYKGALQHLYLLKTNQFSWESWFGIYFIIIISFGCLFFSAKYSTWPNLINASTKSSGSPTWLSIIRAKNVLISGYSWRSGFGSSSFWFSPWSDFGPLGSLVPIIDIHDLHLTVKDVITNDQRSHMLYIPLPHAVTVFINNVIYRFNDTIDDAFIWPHNKNGVYSTKSGYHWLLSLSLEPTLTLILSLGFGGKKFRRNINSSFGWLVTTQFLLCLYFITDIFPLQQRVLVVVT